MTLGAWAYIDDATYWPAPTETGYGGIEFGAPKVIKTKWEDSIEEFTTFSGSEERSRSKVYVMEVLEEGGYLARGDYVSNLDPTTLTNVAYYIKRQDRMRDLRGLHEEIVCYL